MKSIALAEVKRVIKGFGFKLSGKSISNPTKENPLVYTMGDEKEVRVFKGLKQGRYKVCLVREGKAFDIADNHEGLARAQKFAEEVDPTITLPELLKELDQMQKKINHLTKVIKKHGIKD